MLAQSGPLTDSLHDACEAGQLARVRALVGDGHNIHALDTIGYQPLYYACDKNHVECAHYLLEHGADANHDYAPGKFTELHWASMSNRVEIAELLLAFGARVDEPRAEKSETPLHCAAACGALDTAEVLLKAGARVNNIRVHGKTPLMDAIESGSSAMVRLLTTHGADVEQTSDLGHSPLTLSYLTSNINPDVVQAVVDGAADIHLVRTPALGTHLHNLATRRASAAAQCMRVLVNAGADVNAIDPDGQTPLHVGASRCVATNLEALVNLGADIDIADARGRTALDIARDAGDEQTLAVLESAQRQRQAERELGTAGHTPSAPAL